MDHTLNDYLRGRTGDSVPSSPCQKEQNKKDKCHVAEQYEIITNFYNWMWDSFWDNALELTITFTDNILDKYNHGFIQKEIFRLIDKQNLNYRILLFRDYSDVGRLHYHGLIKPTNKGIERMDKLRSQLRNRFGRCEIKRINSREFYLLYMLKIYIERLEITPSHVVSNIPYHTTMFIEPYETEEPYTWSTITSMYAKQREKLNKV